MAVIVKQEISHFTLTRTPEHVDVSQMQAAVRVGSAVSGPAVVETEEVRTSGILKNSIDREMANKEANASAVIRASPQREVSDTGEVSDTDTVVNVESETDKGTEMDVENKWLLRRYSVLCEQLRSRSGQAQDESMMEKCINCWCQARDSCKRAFPKLATPLTKARTLGIKSALDTVCSDVFTATPIGSIVREFVIYGGFLFMLAQCPRGVHSRQQACLLSCATLPNMQARFQHLGCDPHVL